jgi:hypothetical protein
MNNLIVRKGRAVMPENEAAILKVNLYRDLSGIRHRVFCILHQLPKPAPFVNTAEIGKFRKVVEDCLRIVLNEKPCSSSALIAVLVRLRAYYIGWFATAGWVISQGISNERRAKRHVIAASHYTRIQHP